MAFFDAQNTSVPTTYSYDTRQADIERRMKLAQALQESGQAEQPGYSYNGIPVPMSPLSGLAKALQLGLGTWQERSAYEDQKALAQEMQDRRAADMNKFLGTYQGSTVPGTAAVLPETPNASAGEPQQYPGADLYRPQPQNLGTPNRIIPGDSQAAFTALAASPLEDLQQMGVQGVIAENNLKRNMAAELAKEERTQTNALELEAAKFKQPDTSTNIKEYLFDVSQGYQGPFSQWMKENHPPTAMFDPDAPKKLHQFKAVEQKYDAAISAIDFADSILTDVRQMSEYVNQVQSGSLADTKLTAQKLARAFGLPFDEESISNAEALKAKSMDFILKRVQQTKGAISDREMRSFKEASPSLETTPEGNRKILRFFSDVADRMKAENEAVRQAYSDNDAITSGQLDNVRLEARKEFNKKYETGEILLEKDSTGPGDGFIIVNKSVPSR